MIDYQRASEARLTTIATEYNEYAYENVIVAICELRARNVDIPEASIKAFCDKYRLAGIEQGITDFFKSNNVSSYKEYCKETFYEKKLAKPQPEPYQKRVREWDASTLPNAEGSSISIVAASRSLKKVTIAVVLMFVLALLFGIYWHAAFSDIGEGKITLQQLQWQVGGQTTIMLLLFIRIFFHLGRARTMLRSA